MYIVGQGFFSFLLGARQWLGLRIALFWLPIETTAEVPQDDTGATGPPGLGGAAPG